MADLNTLTSDEAAFFSSGELPPNLAAEQAAALEAQQAADAAQAKADADAAALATAAQQPIQPVVTAPAQAPDNTEFLRQALLQSQQAQAQAQAELQRLQAAATQKQEPVAPDPETDPLGAMMHQLNNVNNTVADLQTKLLAQQQVQAQTEALLSFQSSMKAVRDEYVKATPDFDAAYNHLRSVRADDMRVVGIPDTKIQQILLQDEIAIAQTAIQTGKNPAAVMYEMAKRHGYAAKPAGATPPASKLDVLKAGMDAAKLPPAASQPPADLTLASIKSASDADLDKLVQSDDAWAKFAGTGGKSIF